MTVKGEEELTPEERREVADLVRLHLETHPKRIGGWYGLSAKHVRRIFSEYMDTHVSSDALIALRKRMVQAAVPLHGPGRKTKCATP